ncbi:response regulator [Rhodoferax sp. UBA5149]|uniref:response regulator n=1 Tax=Rhodoferax sp. UBA5149 TaxID=1947379 RepID=UPI0025E3823A|nr:response regulator transcription factor [Rhodoferax sp. UBA5149]
MTIKILLADDSQTFVTAVRKFLDMLPGTEVVGQAHDGREALSKAGQLAPDLVLLDISMPELNGLEVARHMRSWPQPPHVVFLSMHDSVDYRAAAQELGAAGFVGKTDFVVDLPPIIERLFLTKLEPFQNV